MDWSAVDESFVAPAWREDRQLLQDGDVPGDFPPNERDFVGHCCRECDDGGLDGGYGQSMSVESGLIGSETTGRTAWSIN